MLRLLHDLVNGDVTSGAVRVGDLDVVHVRSSGAGGHAGGVRPHDLFARNFVRDGPRDRVCSVDRALRGGFVRQSLGFVRVSRGFDILQVIHRRGKGFLRQLQLALQLLQLSLRGFLRRGVRGVGGGQNDSGDACLQIRHVLLRHVHGDGGA